MPLKIKAKLDPATIRKAFAEYYAMMKLIGSEQTAELDSLIRSVEQQKMAEIKAKIEQLDS